MEIDKKKGISIDQRRRQHPKTPSTNQPQAVLGPTLFRQTMRIHYIFSASIPSRDSVDSYANA